MHTKRDCIYNYVHTKFNRIVYFYAQDGPGLYFQCLFKFILELLSPDAHSSFTRTYTSHMTKGALIGHTHSPLGSPVCTMNPLMFL